jgi:methyltransferase family protein
MKRFFDDYPLYFETSGTGFTPRRLNWRHKVLIEDNAGLLRGQSVLDLASHDGRWSFAGLAAGAKYTLGLEGRAELVESARVNMDQYEVPKDRYDFQAGDLHELLKRLEQPFDVIFCFGFLYHTPFHIEVFRDMARLAKSHIIIDSEVAPDADAVIRFIYDATKNKRNSIDYTHRDSPRALVGYPSKTLIEMALNYFGFSVRHLDWHAQGIRNWQGIHDYQSGKRISLIASSSLATSLNDDASMHLSEPFAASSVIDVTSTGVQSRPPRQST